MPQTRKRRRRNISSNNNINESNRPVNGVGGGNVEGNNGDAQSFVSAAAGFVSQQEVQEEMQRLDQMRLSANTRTVYRYNIAKFKRWLLSSSSYRFLMKENGEIDLSNLSATVFKEFVISRKKKQKDGSFVNLSFEGLSVRRNPNLFFLSLIIEALTELSICPLRLLQRLQSTTTSSDGC